MANEAATAAMNISLNGIGKKFRNQWVFKNVHCSFESNDKVAVTGPNGSGKSTLLQIISGYVTPSEGSVLWSSEKQAVPADAIFKSLSFAAPYIDLIEEFSLEENVDFFIRHKPLRNNLGTQDLIAAVMLEDAAAKPLRQFSSGMKQRLKLGLALLADTPVVILDEPLSNLDQTGYDWYRSMISAHTHGRLVFVGSNMVKEEAWFCNKVVDLQTYK
jgi:ABC-type multidrug transport system ATPase subunit